VMSIETDIAELKVKVEYICSFIEEDRKKFERHIIESDPYRKKVEIIDSMRNEMKIHIEDDRKAFKLVYKLVAASMIITILNQYAPNVVGQVIKLLFHV